MKIAFNPSTVAALITPPNNKDITFDLRGRNIFARGVKFCGTDTWRDIKINNVSIDSNILDLRNGSNTTLTNTNGVVTINSTWRPVVDNLTSDSTTSSLSANLGRVLAGLINTLSTNISNLYALRDGSNATGRWRGGLACFDVRNTNYTPYNLNLGLELHFFRNTTNNLKDGGEYNGVFSFRQWASESDWSGGKAHLLSFTDNGNIWHRTSSGDDSWGTWKKLAYSTDIPSSLKNPYSLTTFGVVYDGSAAKTVTTSTFISLVTEGTSTITDGTMFITSLASNSGFADTNAVNVPYKRKAIHLWEYIKAKTDSLYATKSHNHDDRYLRLTGGWMSGDINFGGDNRICWGRNTDSASISFKNDGDGDADSYMSFVTSDNGNEYFRWSHSSGSTNTEWMALRSDGLRVGGNKVSLEGHNHDDRYLKLSGGTMTGIIRATNRGGIWISGRDHCLIRSDDKTSSSYWSAILAIATVNGYWTLGHLGDGGERIGFNYDTDVDYNAGRNNNHVIWLPTGGAEGTLALTSDIPTSLKNPHALTISLNGTSQGPYDGSTAKNINITPSSIGAATSGHNHDGRYVYNYGGTQMDGASINKNALGMTTNSGITGDWWHILQAAWNGEYRWNSLIAFPTLNRNGMYYRSGLDDNTKWGSWVKLLDVNNYSSTLDSRYYTKSEVNTKLGTYLPLSGGTVTGNIILKGGTSADMTYAGNVHPYIRFDNSDSSLNVSLIFTDYDTYRRPAGIKLVGNQGNEWFEAANIYATTFYGALSGNASSANKLTTARNIALGTDLRGSANFDGSSNITISANINACTVQVSSTNGLPFKRIAHFETGGSWNDNALLLYISLGYINGSNGICRVEFRTDNISSSSTSVTASAAVRWLVRNGYGLDSLYAGYYVTTSKAYIDIYLKTTSSYQGTVIRVLLDSRGGINSNVLLINSYYYSDTNHKEAYNSIEAASTALYNRAYTRIVSGSDVGTVSYSNSTGSVHWNNVTNKPSTFTPAAHTHTVFNNNLMIKGTNGVSNSASIHLGIGDSDTGFKWISDGKCLIYANNVAVGEWTQNGMNWFRNPTVNGNKIWNAGNDGSGSGLDADTIDGIDSTGFLRYYNSNSAPSNVDIVNTPSYVWTVSTTGGSVANAIKPSGMDNAWGIIHLHTHIGNYATQLGFGGTTGRMYMRNAYNTSAFGNWQALAFTTDNVASATKLQTARSIWGHSFNGTADVNGTIYINNNNSSEGAIRLNNNINSNARISAIDNQVIFNTDAAIRFGGTSWDWNVWAGLKYNHSNKTIYLGIADNSIFNANSALSGGSLRFPGISNIYATTFNGSLSGNASTATTLQTTRTLWGLSFNGSNNVSGNMSGVGLITFSALSGTNGRALLYLQMADNDYFRIYAGGTGNNGGYAEIATADDGNEPIYVRQYTGVFSSVKRTLTLLDANGYTHFPSYINIGGNENNNSSPDRVWGSNGSDSYLRSYRTSALRVAYANSAGSANSATNSRYLTCPDTRSTMPAPTEYTATTTGISFDFKQSSVTGLSGYTGVMTYRPYASGSDWTGGAAHQLGFCGGDNRLYHRTGTSSWSSTWNKLAYITDNVASATNAYHLRINSANTWSTWYWSGLSNQPSWLWGSNDGTNMYVWNPSNFRVAYASSAGNADKVDGYHYNDFTYKRYIGYNRNGPYNMKIFSKDVSSLTWGASYLIFDIFSSGYSSNRVYFGRYEVSLGHWNNTDKNPTVYSRWIFKTSAAYDCVHVIKDLSSYKVDVYIENNLWDCSMGLSIVAIDGFNMVSSSPWVNLPSASSNVLIVSTTYLSFMGNSSSATKVIVNLHTANDTNYPLVWSNLNNSNTVTENLLFKSWSDLYYNPKNKRLTVGGSIYAAHFYESSDKALKKNIKSILSSTNIPKIREFDWKDTGEHSYGFIALELEELGYGCLVNESDGKKTVNYTATLALTVAKLLNLINIQNKKISNLTKELKALKYGRKKNS